MSGADHYRDGQIGSTQVDFSFLDFNTQTDSAFNDLPETGKHDQVCFLILKYPSVILQRLIKTGILILLNMVFKSVVPWAISSHFQFLGE
jgi:hypothetical protein